MSCDPLRSIILTRSVGLNPSSVIDFFTLSGNSEIVEITRFSTMEKALERNMSFEILSFSIERASNEALTSFVGNARLHIPITIPVIPDYSIRIRPGCSRSVRGCCHSLTRTSRNRE
ncbi:hypothetical protein PHAMO_180087 [Magnetospirillum molischianum DSM 120]|uniref:Uncharacterized protein n=1 Tax=Magnetospirillum molischianum DSM 120 TaxID=1150626 RepID=H8FP30_MAGML|nr:hypothetical protein PHAMO_180087 [Magnetospirillum molischianum DSM 120]